MKGLALHPAVTARLRLPFAASFLALLIFILDTVTDLEIAMPVLYTAVVLISVRFCNKRGVILVSVGCIVLTLLSDVLTTTDSSQTGLVNTVISLLAISATAYLVLKIKMAETAVYEARAQLAHVARVTTLGELTASIAHEINQPLAATIINANASFNFLAARPPNLEEAKQAIECVVKDTNRASDVIARVRSLAKRTLPQKELLDINDSVNEIITLTSREIEENHVSLRTEFSDNLPLIPGDRVQLQQVILNLILNAIESMDGVADEARELFVSTTFDITNAILVVIRDNGIGMEAGKIDNLFDAFYTTKPNGLGIGLAISRSIVEAHGGRIWAERNAPRGAIFQFTLPANPVVAI